MITDSLLNLAKEQDIKTGATGDYLSGPTIDLDGVVGNIKAAPGDIGQAGCPAYVYVVVTTDIVSAGAGTISFRLISQPLAGVALAAPANEVLHAEGPAFTTSDADDPSIIPAGTVLWRVALPMASDLQAYKRHLGLATYIGGNNIASGAISAKIAHSVPEHVAYADGAPSD